MSDIVIVIDRRYCGPPNSANGGYAAGRLAAFVDGTAEVTLRRPPPLDKALDVRLVGEGAVEMYAANDLVATALPATLEIAPLDVPDLATAADAAGRTLDPGVHPLPTCFVCGPLREHGDGLRIHVGPVDPADRDWNGVLAAPWVPAPDLTDGDGSVLPEFVWAALDCPTAFACSSGDAMSSILLGRQTVDIARRPRAGEQCVVAAAWRGRERRKHFAEAALAAADGEVLARCRAVWIEVTDEVLRGAA